MAYILGLDPSLAKSGYVVLDTEAPDSEVVEKGKLKTSTSDGILLQRLLKQQDQVREMIRRYDVKFISMEAPYYGGYTAEQLFALNQFLHKVFLDEESFVVSFPPQQFPLRSFRSLRRLSAFPQVETIYTSSFPCQKV